MSSTPTSPKRKRDPAMPPALNTTLPDLASLEPQTRVDSPSTNNITGRLEEIHFKDFHAGVESTPPFAAEEHGDDSMEIDGDDSSHKRERPSEAPRKKPRVEDDSRTDAYTGYTEPRSMRGPSVASSQGSEGSEPGPQNHDYTSTCTYTYTYAPTSTSTAGAAGGQAATTTAQASSAYERSMQEPARMPPKRKKSPPPLPATNSTAMDPFTWHEDEITGHEINGPDDDGEGINGIGFRPTPSVAAWRTQKRRLQVVEWRTREAREARQRRSERRDRGGGLCGGDGVGKAGMEQERGRRAVRFA